ncbi:MAG TPA: acyltransferase [bacterium]|nr:acyltransferase [bacterium]
MAGGFNSGLWLLRAAYQYNRLRFSMLRRGLRGRAEFGPRCDVWASCFNFVGQGRAVFGPGCIVERGPFPLVLEIAAGGLVQFREDVWVRGKYRPNVITCFEGAAVSIGAGSLINGAIISARTQVTIGKKAMLSWNTTIIDSNHHPLDNDEPLAARPVAIGDYVMIGAGATVLAGATIGGHSVIGAGSVVAGDIPDHAVAAGSPARVIRRIGDRDQCL